MLVGPQFHPAVAPHTNGQSLGITMSPAPDRGQSPCLTDEGIIRRNPSIVMEPVDLAIGPPQVLGVIPSAAIPDGKKEEAFGKHHAAPEMDAIPAIMAGLSPENDLLVTPLPGADPSSDHRRHRALGPGGGGIAEGEVQPAIAGIIRVGHGPHQPALALRPDRRRPWDRSPHATIPNRPQRP